MIAQHCANPTVVESRYDRSRCQASVFKTLQIGFRERLAYLRWLRDCGALTPESDGKLADYLGVGVKWLGKWKRSQKAPNGIAEHEAIETSLREMGVAINWLYKGEGDPPEPDMWARWEKAWRTRVREGPPGKREPRTTAAQRSASK